MTNATLLTNLLTKDSAIVSFAGERISQERQPADETHPSVLFRSAGDEAQVTWNHGYGTIPEDWVIESWAPDSITRDNLRDAIRARLAIARSLSAGVAGIILQPGGSAVELEGSALWGWQDTFRVVHNS